MKSISTRTAMRMLIMTSIITYLTAVTIANDITVATVITVSVFTALITGWVYIHAVSPVVAPAIIAGTINLDDPL